MPFSFKLLTMTAIATLLFQATTAQSSPSPPTTYSCTTYDVVDVASTYYNAVRYSQFRASAYGSVPVGTYMYAHVRLTVYYVNGEGYFTTAQANQRYCPGLQKFNFDAVDQANCGCKTDPKQCPVDFAYPSSTGGGFCYKSSSDASAGGGGCGGWCTQSLTNNAYPYGGCAAKEYHICGIMGSQFPAAPRLAALTGGSDNGQEATAEPPAAAASGSDDADTNDSSDAEIARTVFEGVQAACLLLIAYTYVARKASAAEAQHDDRRPPYDQRGSVASVSEL